MSRFGREREVEGSRALGRWYAFTRQLGGDSNVAYNEWDTVSLSTRWQRDSIDASGGVFRKTDWNPNSMPGCAFHAGPEMMLYSVSGTRSGDAMSSALRFAVTTMLRSPRRIGQTLEYTSAEAGIVTQRYIPLIEHEKADCGISIQFRACPRPLAAAMERRDLRLPGEPSLAWPFDEIGNALQCLSSRLPGSLMTERHRDASMPQCAKTSPKEAVWNLPFPGPVLTHEQAWIRSSWMRPPTSMKLLALATLPRGAIGFVGLQSSICQSCPRSVPGGGGSGNSPHGHCERSDSNTVAGAQEKTTMRLLLRCALALTRESPLRRRSIVRIVDEIGHMISRLRGRTHRLVRWSL